MPTLYPNAPRIDGDPEAAPTHLTQAVAANVILGIVAAVVVFGAPIVPAIIGGVGAGVFLYVRFRIRRRARGAPGRK